VDQDLSLLHARLAALERTNRIYRVSLLVLIAGIAAAATLAPVTAQNPATLRLRELIIEDAEGRPGIVMQAPIAEGPSSQRT
jgi:hypothetical protein